MAKTKRKTRELNFPTVEQLYEAPELVLDRSHPVNDRFLNEADGLRRRLENLTSSLPPHYLKVFRLYLEGNNFTQIAKELPIGAAAVAKAINSQSFEHFNHLTTLYRQRMSLPTLLVRQQMLWRIAVDNEDKAPQITIAALKQLDAQEGIVHQATQGTNNGGIHITIQNFGQAKAHLQPNRPHDIEGEFSQELRHEPPSGIDIKAVIDLDADQIHQLNQEHDDHQQDHQQEQLNPQGGDL